MAHALFKACSEGNLAALHDLLHDVNPYELEVQDESGSTPLIAAVKNGHVDVISALLDKGADPAHGSPEQYTTEQVILDLLAQAKKQVVTERCSNH